MLIILKTNEYFNQILVLVKNMDGRYNFLYLSFSFQNNYGVCSNKITLYIFRTSNMTENNVRKKPGFFW